MTERARIVARLGLAENVPVLIAGELAYDTDTRTVRIGDNSASPSRVMSTNSTGSFSYPNVDFVEFNEVKLRSGGKVDGITPSKLNIKNGLLSRIGNDSFSAVTIVSGDSSLVVSHGVGDDSNGILDIRLSEGLQSRITQTGITAVETSNSFGGNGTEAQPLQLLGATEDRTGGVRIAKDTDLNAGESTRLVLTPAVLRKLAAGTPMANYLRQVLQVPSPVDFLSQHVGNNMTGDGTATNPLQVKSATTLQAGAVRLISSQELGDGLDGNKAITAAALANVDQGSNLVAALRAALRVPNVSQFITGVTTTNAFEGGGTSSSPLSLAQATGDRIGGVRLANLQDCVAVLSPNKVLTPSVMAQAFPAWGVRVTSQNGAALLPNGDENDRPSVGSAGMLRFNTDGVQFEGYDGSQWRTLVSTPPIESKDTDFSTIDDYNGALVVVSKTSTVNVTLHKEAVPNCTVRFLQASTGAIHFVAATGASVHAPNNVTTTGGIYSLVSAVCVANEDGVSAQWRLQGVSSSYTKDEIDARLEEFSAGVVTWSAITSKPTTIAGYSITDAYTKTEIDDAIAPKANSADVYTRTQTNGLLNGKANADHDQPWSTVTGKPTTLAGYGVTDAYTKTEINTALAGKAASATTIDGYNITDAYTKSETNTALATKANNATTLAGYNIADAYTKTQADALLAGKANNATTLAGYSIADAYTKTQADALLAAKADASSYYNKTATDALFATKADVSSVYTKTATDTLLATKAVAATTYSKTEVDAVDAKRVRIDADGGYSSVEMGQARRNLLAASVETAVSLGLVFDPLLEINQENGRNAVTVNGGVGTIAYNSDATYCHAVASGLSVSAQSLSNPFASISEFKRLRSAAAVTISTPKASYADQDRFFASVLRVEDSDILGLGWGTDAAQDIDILQIHYSNFAGTIPIACYVNVGSSNFSYVTLVNVVVGMNVIKVTVPGFSTASPVSTFQLSTGFCGSSYWNTPTLNTWVNGLYLSHASVTNWSDTAGNTLQTGYTNIFPRGVLPWTNSSQITGESLQRLLSIRAPLCERERKALQYYWRQSTVVYGAMVTQNDASRHTPYIGFPVPMLKTPALTLTWSNGLPTTSFNVLDRFGFSAYQTLGNSTSGALISSIIANARM